MSSPPPRVSVVMPVYNAAATLATALADLFAQSLREIEVVAVDDGSADGSGEMLVAAARGEPRLRPVRQAHGGIVAALTAGLAAARADVIARFDADDRCHPRRLELQLARLAAEPALGLVACRAAFGGDRRAAAGFARHVAWSNTLLTPDAIALGRFRESPLAHPSVMFRRELVARHGGYRDGPFPEDYELWLRWLEAGVRMAKLADELVTWNDPPGRLSRRHPRYSVENIYALKAEYLGRWLARHNPHHPAVWVMGGGRRTRQRAAALLQHGVRITAWLDVDPRRIGETIAGVPVRSRDRDLPAPGTAFLLPYVGSVGAVAEQVALLEARGHRRGRDFLEVA